METSALEDEEIIPGLPEPDLDPLTAGKRAFLIRKVSRPRAVSLEDCCYSANGLL
jgi:hypothetical protein